MKVKIYERGIKAYYRPGTTDEQVLAEVVDKRCYRRAKAGFDVDAGERWLDLGANIGSFAIYCRLRGATADCYEPDAGCFKLLLKNAEGFNCVQAAVTASRKPSLTFFKSKDQNNHYRGSVVGKRSMVESEEVKNIYVGTLGSYDGVKMDIEGSELDILDSGLLPDCNKLCMEYHSSHDHSAKNLASRLRYLKSLFKHVLYPPELDRIVAGGKDVKTYFDRFIYCMDRR